MNRYMFSKLVRVQIIIILSCVLLACNDGEWVMESGSISKNHLQKSGFEETLRIYDFFALEDVDQLKITIAESLNNLLLSDKKFRNEFIRELSVEGKMKELLFQEVKHSKARSASKSENIHFSLEELLIKNLGNTNDFKGKASERDKRIALIRDAKKILPNIVIKVPDWANVILEHIPAEDLDYSVLPGINTKDLRFQLDRRDNCFSGLSGKIPIQIKESEKHIPVLKNSNKTIWGDDFLDDHFPTLRNCGEFSRDEYISYSDHNYDYIDLMRLHGDLLNARICPVAWDNDASRSSNTSTCTPVYQRDCVEEKSVIEGFQLASYASLLIVSNQPGGEDVLTFHYNFSVASMCGNLNQTQVCPPTNWKFVFPG